MMWLKVQEGMNRMHDLKDTKELGGTAAYILRWINAMCGFNHIQKSIIDNDKEIHNDSSLLYFSDIWFDSVKSAANMEKLLTIFVLSPRPDTQKAQTYGWRGL